MHVCPLWNCYATYSVEQQVVQSLNLTWVEHLYNLHNYNISMTLRLYIIIRHHRGREEDAWKQVILNNKLI